MSRLVGTVLSRRRLAGVDAGGGLATLLAGLDLVCCGISGRTDCNVTPCCSGECNATTGLCA